ncbi:unnamed protein product [Allacma fusca]|uniref:Integrase catalytic domain-containing protein n=1 Tax=Allacma fusca TaxID=39272 RepID=A0A8J2KIP5_9HEXA|nr:unnamed protein product [Allacma fusca]
MDKQLGYKIVRNNGITTFTDKTGVEGPVAEWKDGLYFIRSSRPSNAKCFSFAVKLDSTMLWHKRLGHVNMQLIKDTIEKGAVEGLKASEVQSAVKCEECQLGKQARKPFPRKTTTRDCKSGEIIHADLAGPMPTPSLGGAKYFLLMKDQASGFRYVNFLKHKNETALLVKHFVIFMETQTGNKVKEFWTDNGTEVVNRTVDTFFKDNGTVHITSAPYCPQMNGKIEREMRTVKDSARTMLIESQVPEFLCAEAIANAVFIHNRLLDSVHQNITPFELIFGKKPRLDYVRKFGCTAFAHVPKFKRKVWDPKGAKCTLVGHGSHNLKYRLYDEESQKVVEAHSATFFEGSPSTDQVTIDTIFQDTSTAARQRNDPEIAVTTPVLAASPSVQNAQQQQPGTPSEVSNVSLFELSDVEEPEDFKDCSQGTPEGNRRIIPLTPETREPIPNTSRNNANPQSPVTVPTREVIIETEKGNYKANIPEEATHAALGKLEENRDRLGIHPVSILNPTVLLMFLLFLVGLAAGQPHSATPVLWRRSEHPVTVGQLEVNTRIVLLDPCRVLANVSIHQDLMGGVVEQCDRLYSEMVLDELGEMCPPAQQPLHIGKNVNQLFSLFLQ